MGQVVPFLILSFFLQAQFNNRHLTISLNYIALMIMSLDHLSLDFSSSGQFPNIYTWVSSPPHWLTGYCGSHWLSFPGRQMIFSYCVCSSSEHKKCACLFFRKKYGPSSKPSIPRKSGWIPFQESQNHIKHLQINAADWSFLHQEYFLWLETFLQNSLNCFIKYRLVAW